MIIVFFFLDIASQVSHGNIISHKADISAGIIIMDTSLITRDFREYFMNVAILASKESKQPRTKRGACIVNDDKQIVGMGCHEMPKGSDKFPWTPKEDKLRYVCHAEMNAIIKKTSFDVKGCTLYVTLYPCNECAMIIAESGIKTVIYKDHKKGKGRRTTANTASIFDAAEIMCWKYPEDLP